MKKYFPNKWAAYKKVPSEKFGTISFGKFMSYRVGGYEIPEDVSCIIRQEDVLTGKIKEYVYKTDLGAKKRINKIMDEFLEPTNITICDAHRIHYLPANTANTEEPFDDMQDYEDERPDDNFNPYTDEC